MDNIFVKSLLDLLHLLATIAWFGTLYVNFTIIRTTVQKTLTAESALPFIQLFMKKSRTIVYVSLAILFITGIPLKIVNHNYVSIINFSNNWQIAMFIKHLFVGILAILSIINFEYITARLQKANKNKQTILAGNLKKMQLFIGMCSVLIAIIIIVVSAVMNHI